VASSVNLGYVRGQVTPGTEWPSSPPIVSSENPISAAAAVRLCSTWTEKAAMSAYERT